MCFYWVVVDRYYFFFGELFKYIMFKPQDHRALAMQAVMRLIQAEQEKAFAGASKRAGEDVLAEVQHDTSVDTSCPPSPRVSPIKEARQDLPMEPEVSVQPLTSVEKGKRSREDDDAIEPANRRTKHSAGRRLASTGDSRHCIKFHGDASTR